MRNRTFVLGAVVVSLITAAAGIFIFSNRSVEGQQKPIERYSRLPKVISSVKTVEIAETNLKKEGTANAFAEINIRNNSDKPIIAFNIESGDENNSSGEMTSGILSDEPPRIIIKPYETYQTRFPISNVLPGFPIRITGVIYADGTEEGDEATLKSMRRKMEHYESIKKEDSSQ